MAEDVDICDQHESAATSCLGSSLQMVPDTISLMYNWYKSKTAHESAKGVNNSEALLPTPVQEAESYGLSDCEDEEHNKRLLSQEDAAKNQSAPQQSYDEPMGHNSAGESSGLWLMASSVSRATGGQSGSVSVLADPAASCGGEPQPPEATRTCQRQESSNGDLSDELPVSGISNTAPAYPRATPEYTRAMLQQTHVDEEWQDLHSSTKMWGPPESLSQKDQERGVPRSPAETEQNSSDTFHQHHQSAITTKYVNESNPADTSSLSVQKLCVETRDLLIQYVNVLQDLRKRVESLEKNIALLSENRITTAEKQGSLGSASHDHKDRCSREKEEELELDIKVKKLLDDEMPKDSEDFREMKRSITCLSPRDVDACKNPSDVLEALHKRGHTEIGHNYGKLTSLLCEAKLIKVKRAIEKLVHEAAVTEPAPVVLHTRQSVIPVTVVKKIAVDLDKNPRGT